VADALGVAPTATVAVMGRLDGSTAGDALGSAPSRQSVCLLHEPGPAALLRQRGWRVAEWNRGTSIAAVWSAAAPATTPSTTAGRS
jgi:hypothetical protein